MTLHEIRALFPHTERGVYLNHAATGPLSRPVVDAIHRFVEERHVSNVENFLDFLPLVEETKRRIGALVGAHADRVEFMPNTSHALSLLAEGLDWQRGDRIAVPGCEFPANVYPFMNLERRGVAVDFIPHQKGVFSLEDIARALTPRTRLLSLSWVQFLSGFRADLEAVGRLCRERRIIFCVDAIQGLGALRLEVDRCRIDFLACGTHKWLMATQGLGFLYVSEALQERIAPPAGWLHGPVDWDNFFDYKLSFHPDATRYRLGTLNNIGIAGLHAALGLYFEAGPAWCERQVLARSAQLAEGLERLGLERFGTTDPAHASGIVTVKHPDAQPVFAYLKEQRITVSLRNRMLRFSPSYYNSPKEIDRVVDAVRSYASQSLSTGG